MDALPDEFRFARSASGFERSILREILSSSLAKGLSSFAIGMPGTDLFPREGIERAASEVLTGEARALQYGEPSAVLKRHVVEIMARRGAPCREEQVFLTTGSQQAMDLLARLLVDPGAPVAVEETIYEGIRIALSAREPRLLSIPTAAGRGIDLDALEELLVGGERPTLLYVIPTGHNPLGHTLGRGERERLAKLARRHRLPVIEDDAYGLIHLEAGGEPDRLPPVRALEERWVFYLGSFSKILAPALRVGWVVAPEEVIARLSPLKHGADVDTSALGQLVAARFLEDGLLPAHLRRIRAAYRARRNAMLAALERHFPPTARWHAPTDGIFIWVELPDPVDTTDLLRESVEEARVAFCPGAAFAVAGERNASHGMRLSFADSTPEEIEEGIARLGPVVRRACG